MPVVKPYPIAGVEPQAAPNVRVQNAAAGDLASFGGNQAQDMMRAGAFMEKAADTTFNLFEREAKRANDLRVEDELNGFISTTQNELSTKPDAFFRLKGEKAINGAQAVTDSLLTLKKEALGRVANDYQRERLSERLDAQIKQARSSIDSHVARQADIWEGKVAAGRQMVIANQASLDWQDTAKLDTLATESEGVARAEAARNGLAGTEAEAAMVADARSKVYANAIEQRLANGEGRAAVALYDKVKGGLDARTNDALALKVKSTRTEIASDDLIARYMPNAARDEVRRFFEAKGYSPEAASALAGHAQAESGFNPAAVNPRDGRDGSDSVGIFQWNADRAKAFRKFAADNKLDPQKRSTQLEFAAWELDNTEGEAGKRLKSAKSLEDASKAVFGYLRPAQQTGRMDYVQAAYEGVGFDKASMQTVADRIINSGAPPEVRQAAYAKLQKQISVTESTRTADIKGLDDLMEATTLAIAAGGGVPRGRLAEIAQRYAEAGDKSKALSAGMLASAESTLYDFANAPRAAQDQVLALLSGKAKEFASSLVGQARKDVAADFARETAAIRTAADKGVKLSSMGDKIKTAIALGHQSGNPRAVQEFLDFASARLEAERLGAGSPVEIEGAINSLRQSISDGNQTNQSIFTLDQLEKIKAQQEAEFKRDAFEAGTKKYNIPVQPIKWAAPDLADQLARRTSAAQQISAGQGGIDVLPFSGDEIRHLRDEFDKGNPRMQSLIMRTLSLLPEPARIGVAAALAGKGQGDQLSRSYAAAMTFIGDKDPAQRATGEQILKGAQIVKEGGAGGRKPAQTSDAWLEAVTSKIGTVFSEGVKPEVPAGIADAIASLYVAKMWAANKAGDKTDTDILNASIKAVVGEPVERNGKMFLPPRGVDQYAADRAIRALNESDLADIRTQDGTAVSAAKVIRYGRLSNANQEGKFFVSFPDPARGGGPGYLVKPDGEPFTVDLIALGERAKAVPMGPDPDAAEALGLMPKREPLFPRKQP